MYGSHSICNSGNDPPSPHPHPVFLISRQKGKEWNCEEWGCRCHCRDESSFHPECKAARSLFRFGGHTYSRYPPNFQQSAHGDSLVQRKLFDKLAKFYPLFPCDAGNLDLRFEILDLIALFLQQHGKTVGYKQSVAKQGFLALCVKALTPLEDRDIRGAAAEMLNLLLAECPPNCHSLVKLLPGAQMLEKLEQAVDWCLQSVFFEVMFRATRHLTPAELRDAFASVQDERARSTLCAGMRPADLGNFQAVTRTFLMAFNQSLGQRQRVYSLRTTNGWADFGLAECSVCQDGQDNPFIGCVYRDIGDLVFAEGALSFSHAGQTYKLVIPDMSQRRLLETIVLPRIEAHQRAASSQQQKPRVSVVSIRLGLPYNDVDGDKEENVVENVHDVWAPSPSSPSAFAVPVVVERAQQQQEAPSKRIRVEAMPPPPPPPPQSPFVGMMVGSLPPQSPLTQTIISFGTALEHQVAEFASRATRDKLQVYAQNVLDLGRVQRREHNVAKKRAREEHDALFGTMQSACEAVTKELGAFSQALVKLHSVHLKYQDQVLEMNRRHGKELESIFTSGGVENVSLNET